jgi:hypothetical protein
MSTFTPEEIERLRTLGNAVNASIYLGLYEGRKKFEPRVEDEVRSHLVDKYDNRRWYVSPDDVEQQKRLLEDAVQRRNSVSALSQKSNQSAPPNLHPTQPKPGTIDLLTGDLFDLSLSSTPVQQSATIQISTPPVAQSLQDDWMSLFTKPAPTTSTCPLTNTSTIPAPLKFPMPVLPPPKAKEHPGHGGLPFPSIPTSQTSTAQQQWECK